MRGLTGTCLLQMRMLLGLNKNSMGQLVNVFGWHPNYDIASKWHRISSHIFYSHSLGEAMMLLFCFHPYGRKAANPSIAVFLP